MKKFNIVLICFLYISTTIFAKNTPPSVYTQGYDPTPKKDTIIGDNEEFTKIYNKTFSVTAAQNVHIHNKFGRVEIKTGNSNQVVVNVKITVKGSKSQADDWFKRINIAFSDGPEHVKAETIIESSGNFWESAKSADYRIDYEVMMPAANRLELVNKYGDSHIAALQSFVRIDQKYGNFSLESAQGLQVDLAYGNGTVSRLTNLNANIGYGKLSVKEVRDAAIKSKYSAFKLDNAANVSVVSSYDDYEVNTVENLTIDSRYGDFVVHNTKNLAVKSNYTDFKIKTLDNSCDLQTNYGSVRIDMLKAGFDNVLAKGSYTDYVITIDPNAAYQFDFSGNYADLARPRAASTRTVVEKGSSKEVSGFVGNANAKSRINVRLHYGDLNIK